jgi:hypothetical protein
MNTASLLLLPLKLRLRQYSLRYPGLIAYVPLLSMELLNLMG